MIKGELVEQVSSSGSVSVGWQMSVILIEPAVEAIRTDEFSQVYK